MSHSASTEDHRMAQQGRTTIVRCLQFFQEIRQQLRLPPALMLRGAVDALSVAANVIVPPWPYEGVDHTSLPLAGSIQSGTSQTAYRSRSKSRVAIFRRKPMASTGSYRARRRISAMLVRRASPSEQAPKIL